MRMRLPIMCLRRPHLSSYLQISHCEASRTSLPQLHVPNIVLSISPAVYVAYTGLEAIQACDPLFDPFPTGSVYQTTIGDPRIVNVHWGARWEFVYIQLSGTNNFVSNFQLHRVPAILGRPGTASIGTRASLS